VRLLGQPLVRTLVLPPVPVTSFSSGEPTQIAEPANEDTSFAQQIELLNSHANSPEPRCSPPNAQAVSAVAAGGNKVVCPNNQHADLGKTKHLISRFGHSPS